MSKQTTSPSAAVATQATELPRNPTRRPEKTVEVSASKPKTPRKVKKLQRKEDLRARQAHLRLKRVGIGSWMMITVIWAVALSVAALVAIYFTFQILQNTGVFLSLTEASAAVLASAAPAQSNGVYYFFTQDWVMYHAIVIVGALTAAFVIFSFLVAVIVNCASALVGGLRVVLEDPAKKQQQKQLRKAERQNPTPSSETNTDVNVPTQNKPVEEKVNA